MSEFIRGLGESKGLQVLKTTTGLIGAKRIRKPHEAYLELSSLEIERHRLNREKDKAESRIKDINKRFEEIGGKVVSLLKFIKEPKNMNKKKNRKDSKPEPIPSYRKSPENIRERTITY
ncbi:MAG: hypothetical protein AABY49_10930 [Planctomycetota bacterium]